MKAKKMELLGQPLGQHRSVTAAASASASSSALDNRILSEAAERRPSNDMDMTKYKKSITAMSSGDDRTSKVDIFYIMAMKLISTYLSESAPAFSGQKEEEAANNQDSTTALSLIEPESSTTANVDLGGCETTTGATAMEGDLK